MLRTLEEYEDLIRDNYSVGEDLTPTSAIVSIDTNSFAGSGERTFADFGDAICWFWEACDPHVGSNWLPDEHVSDELREWRRRFRALLTRFIQEGYAPDMAKELAKIVYEMQGGVGIPMVAVGGVEILSDDLSSFLDEWWNDPERNAYAAEFVERGEPIPEFDFSNPEHTGAYFEWQFLRNS